MSAYRVSRGGLQDKFGHYFAEGVKIWRMLPVAGQRSDPIRLNTSEAHICEASETTAHESCRCGTAGAPGSCGSGHPEKVAYEEGRVLSCDRHCSTDWDSVCLRAGVRTDAYCASPGFRTPVRCSDNAAASSHCFAAVGRSGDPANHRTPCSDNTAASARCFAAPARSGDAANDRTPRRHHSAVQDEAKGADHQRETSVTTRRHVVHWQTAARRETITRTTTVDQSIATTSTAVSTADERPRSDAIGYEYFLSQVGKGKESK